MKARIHRFLQVWNTLAVLPLLLSAIPAPAAPPAGSATARTVKLDQTPIPQSIFVVPASPREGRNPFFLRASTSIQAPQPKLTTVDTSMFVLNGITAPPKATVMINGRTMEVGEEAEVKTPVGEKVSIRCLEIKTNSAVFMIKGQRRELYLRAGV